MTRYGYACDFNGDNLNAWLPGTYGLDGALKRGSVEWVRAVETLRHSIDLHLPHSEKMPSTLAEAGVYDIDTLPRLIIDPHSRGVVVARYDEPFLIEIRKDTP